MRDGGHDGPFSWPGQDSNLGATDYESAALPLSYRAARGRSGSARGDASTPPGPIQRLVRYPCEWMLAFAFSESFAQTFALLITFLGIGVLVNVLIVYIVA